MNKTITLFPVGAIAVAVFAMEFPDFLMPLRSAIVPLLGVVMFGMGMTLTINDFKRVFSQPVLIALGLFLQFLLMPLIAWLLSHLLLLPLPLMTGLVLVGTCPGGTASNVICYLARGDVALSITLTSVSTFMAILLTPLLTWFYIGQRIPVPVIAMVISILMIIIIPVLFGLLLNQWIGNRLDKIKRKFPLISTLAIILIIGIIMAGNHAELSNLVFPVIIAVVLHNMFGLAGGYFFPRILGYEEKQCRTLAIEVGMQNSGLGVVLAEKYFSTMAALPGAIFSIWHNISGAVLAGIWSARTKMN
jgi:bile acid:Na+ symporter, BASS family